MGDLKPGDEILVRMTVTKAQTTDYRGLYYVMAEGAYDGVDSEPMPVMLSKIARTEGPHPGESGEWVMVPREPTPKMTKAGDTNSVGYDMGLGREFIASVYRNMVEARPAASPPPKGAGADLATYDAGLLGDYGGGNVEWWQDYLRSELATAHEFYQLQVMASAAPALPVEGVTVTDEMVEAVEDLLAACESEFGVPDENDEDDEAVGGNDDGPMAITFGMLRRVRAALTARKPGGV